MTAAKITANITPLVELDHGEVWTTSLLIADRFDKRHADVLRAVEKLECSAGFAERNFALSEYVDATGRKQPMYRITRDGFSLLAFGFTGRAAAVWKEAFVDAFSRMERELRRIAVQKSLPDWKEARELGKAERRGLTDAEQMLCQRAHVRGESSSPESKWIMGATRTVTSALFQNEFRESIAGVRERLTARQLHRLAFAEQAYADAVLACLDSDLHHKAIHTQAKVRLLAFANATGGREVPGVDPVARRLGGAR
jgi:Rha family phage regulatory protein